MERVKSLTSLSGTITELPRGGYLVQTSIGYMQFGSPPETIKDTMLLPLSVPNIFILPYEHFDPAENISMAEIEFPIYYNYFLKNKKVHIFVNPDHVENLKIVLQEAIFGPVEVDVTNEIEPVAGSFVPEIMKEMKHFRADRKLEDLVDIRPIHPSGFRIKGVTIVPQKDHGFIVYENDKLIAKIPAKLKFQRLYDLGTLLKEPFVPPDYGITCLGPSHGFDPEQNTSGFLFWINKVGIMVDPPVNSTFWLRDSNVNPKLIDTVILTHCHADHDSGTFQKLLEETRVTVYTTPTVLQSFLTKYSALTRIPVSTLLGMFDYFPVKMNMEYNIHGAQFNFFYTLHSIPTMGFQFNYRDKTFVYSSDHLNEPVAVKKMHEDGVLSKERYNFLVNFPWHTDIIYHEAGIPPLHTPVSYLNSLPDDIQKKITVYHIAEKLFPKGETNLHLAKFGIGETLYPDIEKHKFEEPYEILDVFSRIDIFNDLPNDKWKDLLLITKKENFQKGNYIIRKDTPGDKFYIIVLGNVAIGGVENAGDKVYGTYEYFGEVSLVFNRTRTADVIAATNVEAYSIEKNSFLRLIRNTKVEQTIRKIAEMRDGVSWSAIKSNRFFKELTSSQVTQLESILEIVEVSQGEKIISAREIYSNVWLFLEGGVDIIQDGKPIGKCEKGDLIGDVFEVKSQHPSALEYIASGKSKLFRISGPNIQKFLTENPGVLMKMMYADKSRK